MADFNEAITAGLLEGTLAALEERGVEDVTVVRVPGAWELPLAARKLIEAGMDGVVAVGAVIEGETVVVHSEKVAAPVAVRYGWSDGAEGDLFNEEGLPASSFRTDDWPGVTDEKKYRYRP